MTWDEEDGLSADDLLTVLGREPQRVQVRLFGAYSPALADTPYVRHVLRRSLSREAGCRVIVRIVDAARGYIDVWVEDPAVRLSDGPRNDI